MKDAPLPVSQHLLSCHTRGNSSDVKKTKPKKLTLFCSLTKKILVINWKDYFWIRSVFTLCFTFCLFSHLDVKTESKFIDDVFLQRNIKWNMSGLLNGTFYLILISAHCTNISELWQEQICSHRWLKNIQTFI